MNNYLKMKQESIKAKERNDCTVIAVAIAARLTYLESYALLKLFGRPDRGGAHRETYKRALQWCGFRIEPVTNLTQPNSCAYTPKSIHKRLPRGHYVCISSGHAFALVNGEINDWTNGRNHRIIEAFSVICPKGIKPAIKRKIKNIG